MPNITIGQLSDDEYRLLVEEARRRGVPIEALADEAVAKALDARARRVVRAGNVSGLKRP